MQAELSQPGLFEQRPELPHGLIYEPEFLTPAEQAGRLAEIGKLPFREARVQQYTARRRVVRYGEGDYPASYGPAAEEVNPRRPFPDFLVPVRRKVAQWLGVAEQEFAH